MPFKGLYLKKPWPLEEKMMLWPGWWCAHPDPSLAASSQQLPGLPGSYKGTRKEYRANYKTRHKASELYN